ncbi:GNAT family N-acetyltransferase [Bremerella cremea]|uniref:GNAT family N-acetyltransferase n=1 Tax=Bremerella cremea TaxID=1031537 RepID=UPI0031F10B9F
MDMVQIRPADPNDNTQLQRLFEDVMFGATFPPPETGHVTDFGQATEGEKIFVAQAADGAIVGIVTIWEPDSFIHYLLVAGDRQRQGIGTCLLESLEAWLPLPWKLKCEVSNRRALAFYRTLGWTKIETGTGESGPYFLLLRE